eukprot:2491192-Pyramimonas_sp.AAC.2
MASLSRSSGEGCSMVSPQAVGPPSSYDSRLSSHSSWWRRLTVAESLGIRGGWAFPSVVSPSG